MRSGLSHHNVHLLQRRDFEMRNLLAWLVISFATVVSVPAAAQGSHRRADTAAVTDVLGRYRAAIERLDVTGTERLFTSDSQIFENGGVEGTYANYLAHHLGPELREFRSFRFSDVNVEVRFEGPVAVATESYSFRIEPITGAPVERRGVTTSVLRKVGSGWRIISSHNSSRAPRPRPAG